MKKVHVLLELSFNLNCFANSQTAINIRREDTTFRTSHTFQSRKIVQKIHSLSALNAILDACVGGVLMILILFSLYEVYELKTFYMLWQRCTLSAVQSQFHCPSVDALEDLRMLHFLNQKFMQNNVREVWIRYLTKDLYFTVIEMFLTPSSPYKRGLSECTQWRINIHVWKWSLQNSKLLLKTLTTTLNCKLSFISIYYIQAASINLKFEGSELLEDWWKIRYPSWYTLKKSLHND